jgi:hypothetical protein
LLTEKKKQKKKKKKKKLSKYEPSLQLINLNYFYFLFQIKMLRKFNWKYLIQIIIDLFGSSKNKNDQLGEDFSRIINTSLYCMYL